MIVRSITRSKPLFHFAASCFHCLARANMIVRLSVREPDSGQLIHTAFSLYESGTWMSDGLYQLEAHAESQVYQISFRLAWSLSPVSLLSHATKTTRSHSSPVLLTYYYYDQCHSEPGQALDGSCSVATFASYTCHACARVFHDPATLQRHLTHFHLLYQFTIQVGESTWKP